jgi:hypothetical protein
VIPPEAEIIESERGVDQPGGLPPMPAVTELPDALYVELLLIHDAQLMRQFNNDTNAAATAGAVLANQVATIYSSTLWGAGKSITVVLAGQRFWTVDPPAAGLPPIGPKLSFSNTLDGVHNWVLSQRSDLGGYDAMMLLSGRDFEETIVGMAYFRGICEQTAACPGLNWAYNKCWVGGPCCIRYSHGIVKYNTAGLNPANTLAHELGHLLGFYHDGEDDATACDPKGSLMAATLKSTTSLESFSPCSIKYNHRPYECLANVPAKTLVNPPVASPSVLTSSPSGLSSGNIEQIPALLISQFALVALLFNI